MIDASRVTLLHIEDGGSMDLRNVGILPQHYTAPQPRRWRQHGQRRHRPRDLNLNRHRRENLKSHITL
jgi:hypothetical protein